ncbi:C-type lectin domain family 10 member A-like [Callospermophilus lateralis]|uniref:C-type lectin domain family 10 member A-like n=1 Tax=Callospermophilus lateralis TaxID=76772 RepID=UPI0040387CCF
MAMEYEDLQHLGSEEKNKEIRKAPPPQVGLWHICSEPRLILFSLGLSLLLLVVVCVIRSPNSKLHRDLDTLRTTFRNFSVDTGAKIQALTSHGQSLQETITSLKAEVEDHRQELLAGTGCQSSQMIGMGTGWVEARIVPTYLDGKWNDNVYQKPYPWVC